MNLFSFSESPAEVHLENSPLLRTLCQIRYSSTPEIVDDESEKEFAAKVKNTYPVRGIVHGVSAPVFSEDSKRNAEIFRTFEDAQGEWKVTLASSFVALETQGYGRREEFVARVKDVIGAVSEVKKPPKVERVGVRYTNRIEDPHGISNDVHQEFLGWLPHVQKDDYIEHQVMQTLLQNEISQAKILVQSALLPPGAVFDSSIPAASGKSWMLDIDAYSEDSLTFEKEVISKRVDTLSRDAYKIFYRTVTDDFRARKAQ